MNPDMSQWPGAYVLKERGVAGSISGFKAFEDEAAILTCLHRFGALDGKALKELQTKILLLNEGELIINTLEKFLDMTIYIG